MDAPTDFPDETTQSAIVSYKRRINELEQELEDARTSHTKPGRRRVTPLLLGRCIRRLVTLSDRVEDLVSEVDRRTCLDELQQEEHSEEEEWLYAAYVELLRWQPSLRKALESQEDLHRLSEIYKELNKGADSARGDDAASLKPAVIQWLLPRMPASDPNQHTVRPLHPSDKDGRGFDHDITGRLLCPVDYNWDDPEQRAAIRDYHPDFLVTAHSWPAFLYTNERYNTDNPTEGFLRNILLVKAFKHIFTSPTSAAKLDESDCGDERLQKRSRRQGHRTRSHVAALLGMKSVSPRAIAYIAVQLRFALSNCGSWALVDGEFNYLHFYRNIISFFESAKASDEKKEISDLLLWWNRQIFGRTNMSVYRPQETQKMSVAKLLAKRAQR